jgi:hypothetical protein
MNKYVQFQMQLSALDTTLCNVDELVLELVNYMWTEASGELEKLLAVPAANINADQVSELLLPVILLCRC